MNNDDKKTQQVIKAAEESLKRSEKAIKDTDKLLATLSKAVQIAEDENVRKQAKIDAEIVEIVEEVDGALLKFVKATE